ncbi:PREDICTED: uncharacterized protein LOC109469530 [Branchiostoma belcheri]|uniref:Uncharacterized protein LOC109469530 n=1 Tax=Branchiostoma belcheri TaxID=7741 RepID=A0A6P4YPL1_BRABE|nr:PREDICTED: uncharacterized protein LOC109469530 [Branchiostoma belcheri]XP_019623619.1 PREDICTED: uncharacterized protein LOC109469530 [Branchiostoma belcheri]KAI8516725.1 hypothetical protein Bbelb_053060 [Branchiostoma belcheri]
MVKTGHYSQHYVSVLLLVILCSSCTSAGPQDPQEGAGKSNIFLSILTTLTNLGTRGGELPSHNIQLRSTAAIANFSSSAVSSESSTTVLLTWNIVRNVTFTGFYLEYEMLDKQDYIKVRHRDIEDRTARWYKLDYLQAESRYRVCLFLKNKKAILGRQQRCLIVNTTDDASGQVWLYVIIALAVALVICLFFASIYFRWDKHVVQGGIRDMMRRRREKRARLKQRGALGDSSMHRHSRLGLAGTPQPSPRQSPRPAPVAKKTAQIP